LRKKSFNIRPGAVELVLSKPIPVPTGNGKDAERMLMDQVHEAIAREYIDQE
jgi:hypothetical protein